MRIVGLIMIITLALGGLGPAAGQAESALPFIYYWNGGFVIERADGTDSTRLAQSVGTPCSGVHFDAAWSGAGHWLMWNSASGDPASGPVRWCAVRYDDSRRLTTLELFGGNNYLNIAWSPAENDLLMVSSLERPTTDRTHPEHDPAVYVIDAERDDFVLQVPFDQLYQLAEWSSDGQFILQFDPSPDVPVRVIPVNGDAPFTLDAEFLGQDATGWGRYPVWTPDHRLVYRRVGTDTLVIENLATREALEFPFTAAAVTAVEWNPTGDPAILFTRDDRGPQTWRLSLATQTLEKLSGDLWPPYRVDPYGSPSPYPKYSSQFWSPDGQGALVERTDHTLVWLFPDGSLADTGFPPQAEDEQRIPLAVQWRGVYAFVVWGQVTTIYDLDADKLVTTFQKLDRQRSDVVFPEWYEVSADGHTLAYLGRCDTDYATILGYCLYDWAAQTSVYLMPNPTLDHRALTPYNAKATWLPDSDLVLLAENVAIPGSGLDRHWSIASADGTLYRQLTSAGYAVDPAPLPANVDTSSLAHSSHSVVPGPEKTLLAHGGWSDAVAWSADGGLIATAVDNRQSGMLWIPAGGDNGARVWDAASGELIAELTLDGCPMGAKPTYNAKASGARRQADTLSGTVLALAWSPQTLGLMTEICSQNQRRVIVWDVTGATPLQTFEDARALAFHPDGQQIALGYGDGAVTLIDAATGTVNHSLAGGDAPILALSFSADGSRLAAMTAPRLVVWEGDQEIFHADCPEASWTDLALSPDGRTLAAATRWGACGELKPGSVVYDLASGSSVFNPGDSMSVVAFSPDGRSLAVTGNGVAVYDTQTWQMSAWYYGDGVDLAWSPDSRRFVTASSYGAYFWALPLLVDHPATVHVIKDDQLNVRAGAGMAYDILARLDEGAVVTLLEGPQDAEGYRWWRVRTADGVEGWAVERADGVQTLVP